MKVWQLMAGLWLAASVLAALSLLTPLSPIPSWIAFFIAFIWECVVYVNDWEASTEL